MAIPFDVIITGEALNDFGFMAFNNIEGLGLNTFGFLWPINGIWAVCMDCDDPVSTTWTDCADGC